MVPKSLAISQADNGCHQHMGPATQAKQMFARLWDGNRLVEPLHTTNQNLIGANYQGIRLLRGNPRRLQLRQQNRNISRSCPLGLTGCLDTILIYISWPGGKPKASRMQQSLPGGRLARQDQRRIVLRNTSRHQDHAQITVFPAPGPFSDDRARCRSDAEPSPRFPRSTGGSHR